MSDHLAAADPTHARRLALAADGALSVKDAAAFCGLSRSNLYERMDAGTLSYTQVGSRRLIPRRGLVELLADRMTVTD